MTTLSAPARSSFALALASVAREIMRNPGFNPLEHASRGEGDQKAQREKAEGEPPLQLADDEEMFPAIPALGAVPIPHHASLSLRTDSARTRHIRWHLKQRALLRLFTAR